MYTLSVVIPCFNEENTLQGILERVRAIADENLALEIIIVDDGSTDNSLRVAQTLAKADTDVKVFAHAQNAGKGAALRTGFLQATGDFVAVQDADLEYDPRDLRSLLGPLISGDADVVLGSRFLSHGAHRVLYFWHYIGNRLLTFASNMLTDLNLTDMETCYKVFRREVIQQIQIQENRFGFEPEIVAKVAQMRVRIFEMGISYHGRTYAEGKKIGIRDGFRAVYCIVRYNAPRAPLPLQFALYLCAAVLIGISNAGLFKVLSLFGMPLNDAVLSAAAGSAALDYAACTLLLFRHQARWRPAAELSLYLAAAVLAAVCDTAVTAALIAWQLSPLAAKITASALLIVPNFMVRRFLIFSEPQLGPWRPQQPPAGDASRHEADSLQDESIR